MATMTMSSEGGLLSMLNESHPTYLDLNFCTNHEPVRSAIIDSCIRVVDNGRHSYHKKVFFIFTVYNTPNHNDQLKFGGQPVQKMLLIGFVPYKMLQFILLKITCLVLKDNGHLSGLRLFKEAKERDSSGKHWGDHPAIMAVGVIDASSEAVFSWDFCFYKGDVVEHLDGHTDIIHAQLYNQWPPWSESSSDQSDLAFYFGLQCW